MILLIDNYDSFVHNLARYFQRMGQPTHVVRNDEVQSSDIRAWRPAAIVLSPGPCTPQQAGICLELVRTCWRTIPILGVCLGHQTIGEAFGGRIVRASVPMHGRVTQVHHNEQDSFAGLPNPFAAARYHSLVIDEDTLPDCLQAVAHADDGTLMAVQHREALVVGWQFHPESILTESGYALLANFLRMAGLPADASGLFSQELVARPATPAPLPTAPLTF